MALIIHLKKDAQVIVNGAVLDNASGRTISLAVRNNAAILRGSEILAPSAATTPASRIYFALQCAYLFPDRRDEHLVTFSDLLTSYLEAAPSAAPLVAAVIEAIESGHLYEALKRAQFFIWHEGKVLDHVQERLVEELRDGAAAGQPAGDGSLGADPGGAADEGGAGVA